MVPSDGTTRTTSLSSDRLTARDAGSMVAPTPPSAELPALYRAVLDGVAMLERRGERPLATSIRRRAIAAYANAWDDRHRDRLVALLERLRRELARGDDRPERAVTGRFATAADR
jgi:hypothetical protein